MIITVNHQAHNAVRIKATQPQNLIALAQPGIQGIPGSQILNGAGVPSDLVGVKGDYYIDTIARTMYGPKTTTWGLPILSLGNSSVVEEFSVNPSILSAKYVTLQATPTHPNDVELMVYGGIEQRHGVDYVINGNVLSWNGLALELLLDLQTTFTVRYII